MPRNAMVGTMNTVPKYPGLYFGRANDENYVLRNKAGVPIKYNDFPDTVDILIVGGGLAGAATAYYTKLRISRIATVAIVDRDPYSHLSGTANSIGLIRQQNLFNLNSQVASLSWDLIRFLRQDPRVTEENFFKLKVEPRGTLMLWPIEAVDKVKEMHKILCKQNQFIDLLSAEELEERFPRIYNPDKLIATYGLQNEGYVDPVALRNLYIQLGGDLGVEYYVGDVVEFNQDIPPALGMFDSDNSRCNAVVVKLPSGEYRHLSYGLLIFANSSNAHQLELKTDIKPEIRKEFGDLSCLQSRRQMLVSFHCPHVEVLKYNYTLVDTDGTLVVRDGYGGDFICILPAAKSETVIEELSKLGAIQPETNLSPWYKNKGYVKVEMSVDYFQTNIRPALAKRMPDFSNATLNRAKVLRYEYNSYDGQPIFGYHPFFPNAIMTLALGPRQAQYAPTFGLITSDYITSNDAAIDLATFNWRRMEHGLRIEEIA